MRVQGFLAAAAAAALLALPATASAADPLPVGQADGVRVTTSRSGTIVRFGDRAAKLYRRIAGRQIEVGCDWIERSDKLGITFGGKSSGTEVRVPRRRTALRIGLGASGADYCTISPSRNGVAGEPIVSVPLTQAGAVLLDERRRAMVLYGVLTWAGEIADRVTPSAYPSPERMARGRFARAAARAGFPVVALAAPTDTPAAGSYGYWSDGRRSAAVVTLSAAGRRLHIDVGPDDEFSSNVLGFLFGD